MALKRGVYLNIAKYVRDLPISASNRLLVGRAICRALLEDNPTFDKHSFMYIITRGKENE